MENYKQVLEELIEHSQKRFNNLKLFIGEKPENYFLPSIQIGSYPPTNEPAFFVEISIGDNILIRDSLAPNTENEENINLLCKRVLLNVLLRGLFDIHCSIEEMKERRNKHGK